MTSTADRSATNHQRLAAESLAESIGAIVGVVLTGAHLTDEQRRDVLYRTRTYLVDQIDAATG